MKKIFIALLASILLAACGQAQPQITDNGNPGTIRVNVFYDENQNGKMDAGEAGLMDRVSVSQQNSCPPSDSNGLTNADTNSSGEVVFKDLKPGKYCVAFMDNKAMTTAITREVNLSSDQEIKVVFGLSEK
jgi:uncharacterized protein (DUF2141 family)